MPDVVASFSARDRERVNDAVAAAEKLTSAELVVVVADRSAEYHKGQSGAALLSALVVVAFADALFDPSTLSLLLLVLVGFVVGNLVAVRVPWVLQRFVSGAQRAAAVSTGAAAALVDRSLRRSSRDTGVVIYAARFEGLGVIAADAEVREALGEPLIWQAEFALGQAVRRGELSAGVVAAVETLAKPLADALPRPATLMGEQAGDVVIR